MRSIYVFICIIMMSLVCSPVFASSGGIEKKFADFADYLTSTLIPVTTLAGAGIGALLFSLGSGRGVDIIRNVLIGGAIGTGAGATIQALFF